VEAPPNLGRLGVRENPVSPDFGPGGCRGTRRSPVPADALTKPAHRSDTTYVAGCLFRVVTLCAHAVHAKAGHWVINKRGIVDAADRLTSVR
jgi:predicted metal-binding protein